MMNIQNLTTLATYLDTLPLDYEDFEMSDFLTEGDPTKYHVYALENGGVSTVCGAVACAVGHGPSAGFLFKEHELVKAITLVDNEWVDFLKPNWDAYSERVFAPTFTSAWDVMFGGSWSRWDNTHIGAAARIRFVVDHHEEDDDFFRDIYFDRDPMRFEKYVKAESLEYWKEQVV